MTDQAANLDKITRFVEQSGDSGLAEWWPQFLASVLPEESSSKAECREQRDEHLRAAFALMHQQTVRAFQYRIVGFMEIWPGIKHYQHPPKSLLSFEREFFYAFACNVQIPTSIGQIHQILFGKPAKEAKTERFRRAAS